MSWRAECDMHPHRYATVLPQHGRPYVPCLNLWHPQTTQSSLQDVTHSVRTSYPRRQHSRTTEKLDLPYRKPRREYKEKQEDQAAKFNIVDSQWIDSSIVQHKAVTPGQPDTISPPVTLPKQHNTFDEEAILWEHAELQPCSAVAGYCDWIRDSR